MMDHIGEDAALYALGALDEAAQAAIDRHVADCAACAALLARASDDVAEMANADSLFEPPRQLAARIDATLERGGAVALPHGRPSRSWRSTFAAIAAAIILAFVPSMYLWQQNQAMHQAMLAQSDAMARIATSPHRTAAFASIPNARVMYGPDGSWYCIVVRGARVPMQVAWKHDGSMTMLGTAVPHGDVALLYLPKSHRMDQLALMEDSRVVGQAQLVF